MLSKNTEEPSLGLQESEVQDINLRSYLDEIVTELRGRHMNHVSHMVYEGEGNIGVSDEYIFKDTTTGYEEWKNRVEQRVGQKLKKSANMAALSVHTYMSNALLVHYGSHFSEFLNKGQFGWLPFSHGVILYIQNLRSQQKLMELIHSFSTN